MAFEWDVLKAESNFRSHRVRFSDAIGVFADDHAIVIEDESDDSERRFVALGMGLLGFLLVVVFTYREENIRLISARRAEPREMEEYSSQL